jgi:hypothetical protein
VEIALTAGVWTTLLDTDAQERDLPGTIDGDGGAGVRVKLPARSALILGSVA